MRLTGIKKFSHGWRARFDAPGEIEPVTVWFDPNMSYDDVRAEIANIDHHYPNREKKKHIAKAPPTKKAKPKKTWRERFWHWALYG